MGSRSDGTEKKTLVLIYCKEYRYCGMTKKFAKAAWLRLTGSVDDCYKFLSLEAQDALSNSRQSPAQSVDVEVNPILAPNVDESRMNTMPEDDHE